MRAELHRHGHHVQKAHGRRSATLATDGSHTQGGMIALIPSAEDAKRLAIGGGEAAKELHLTLAFLGGDVSVYDDGQRAAVVDAVRLMFDGAAKVTANIFGIAHWNANSDDPSWVWSVGDAEGGPSLAATHAYVTGAFDMADDAADGGVSHLVPEQHTPWVAHVCAAYTDDLSLAPELEKRLGSIIFDRVRVAFGDDDTDISLVDQPEAVTAAADADVLRRQPKDWESHVDFLAINRAFVTGVDDVMQSIGGYIEDWKREIAEQCAEDVEKDDLGALADIEIETEDALKVLISMAQEAADEAGKQAENEARHQGVDVPKWALSGRAERLLERVGNTMLNLMADSFKMTARRVTIAMAGGGEAEPEEVETAVLAALNNLSEAGPREAIGAVLMSAQNQGRQAVFDVTPPATYYASEMLDKNTCGPCRRVDGHAFASQAAASKQYPTGGYRRCQGTLKCRGMVVAKYPEGQEAASQTSTLATEGSTAAPAAEGITPVTTEVEDLGGKPNPGTKPDKRLDDNDPNKKKPKGKTKAHVEIDPATIFADGDSLDAPVIPDDARTAPWTGPIAVEGKVTGDGREFAGDSLTWADPPLPLRWNKEDSHGGEPHTVAVNVGRIDKVWREVQSDGTNLIMGEGVLDLSDEDGQRVHDKIRGEFIRGVSIDADSIGDADVEMIWPEAGPSDGDDEDDDMFARLFATPEKILFKAGRIRAATLVDIPAFAEAYIALTDPDTQAVVAGGRPTSRVRHRAVPACTVDGLTAGGPQDENWLAPYSWYSDPKLTLPTGITVTDDGRVYGHAATWGTCHIGMEGVCTTAPMENAHSYFMTGEVPTADGGRVPVGQITVGTGHAPLSYGAVPATEHYDHTGHAVADVAVGNDAHGIWVAGAIRPGADPQMIHELRASGQVSGDWRRIGSALRLVGLLAVNVPGFPVPRTQSRVLTSGGATQQTALVAAGRPSVAHGYTPEDDQKRAMKIVMDMLSQQVHADGR
jgi:hypothetical protein